MSRYPQLSYPAATYDRSLVYAAPNLTAEDRQAGYNVDILEQGNSSRPYEPNSAFKPPPENPFQDEKAYEPPHSPLQDRTSTPWYRRKWGFMIIALTVIVIIGIICGVAAGVATARNSRNTSRIQDSSTTEQQSNNTGRTSSAVTLATTNNGPSTTTPVIINPTTTNVQVSVLPIDPTTTILPGETTLDPSPTPSPLPGYQPGMPPYCFAFPFIPDCAPYLRPPRTD